MDLRVDELTRACMHVRVNVICVYTFVRRRETKMGCKRKTWQQKLEDSKNFPKRLELEPNFPCYRALRKMGAESGDSVVLAPGLEINTIMKNVPEGKLVTLKEICQKKFAKFTGVL